MFAYFMRREFERSVITKMIGALARPVLASFRDTVDPRRYNGASLIGLQGIVIKSHGSADQLAFAHAIEEAILEVEKDVPQRIGSQLGSLLNERVTG